MYLELDKKDNTVTVIAEDSDKCVNCRYILDCPLINAFTDEVIIPRYESIHVETCPMYKGE